MSEQADNKATSPEPAFAPALAPAPAPAPSPVQAENNHTSPEIAPTPGQENNRITTPTPTPTPAPEDAANSEKKDSNRNTMCGIACVLGTCCCFMLIILVHFVLVATCFSKPLSWVITEVTLSGLESSGGEFRFDVEVGMAVNNPNVWPMIAQINTLEGKVSSIPRIQVHPDEFNSSIYEVCRITLPRSVEIGSHKNTTFSLSWHVAVEQRSGNAQLLSRLAEDCTMDPNWETHFRVTIPKHRLLGYELPALEVDKAVSCSKEQVKTNSTNSTNNADTNASSTNTSSGSTNGSSESFIERSSHSYRHRHVSSTELHHTLMRLEERLG